MSKKEIILFGPPGAGKGTEAKLVAQKYGLAHISTGDMLRAEVLSGSELGNKVKSLIDEGLLVSDDLMLEMVKKRVAEKDCESGYILDGFPRTIKQAEELDKIVDLGAVYELAVKDEEIVNRISKRRVCNDNAHVFSVNDILIDGQCPVCGSSYYQRADDKEETVYKRIDIYRNQTLPLLEHYESKELLETIDGCRSIEKVFSDICESLDKKWA